MKMNLQNRLGPSALKVVGVVLGALLAVGGSATAYAGFVAQSKTGAYGESNPISAGRAQQQQRMEPLALAIQATVDPRDDNHFVDLDGKPSGFSSVIMDGNPSHPKLDLWWKGWVAPSVQRLIDGSPSVRVDVHPAAFSGAEMVEATSRVDHARTSPNLKHTIRMISIVPDTDGSVLTVTFAMTTAKGSAEQAKKELARAANVPVVFRVQAFGKSDLDLNWLIDQTAPSNQP
ncbi:MAG: hypothetical protein JWQ12_2343 [Glaciihabitans sp.]|nr:hypothetical protein [Glaciihabitans sp.]